MESTNKKFHGYEEITQKIDELGEIIDGAPVTYFGGILIRVLKVCRDKVFKDEQSLRKFINNVLEDKPRKRSRTRTRGGQNATNQKR